MDYNPTRLPFRHSLLRAIFVEAAVCHPTRILDTRSRPSIKDRYKRASLGLSSRRHQPVALYRCPQSSMRLNMRLVAPCPQSRSRVLPQVQMIVSFFTPCVHLVSSVCALRRHLISSFDHCPRPSLSPRPSTLPPDRSPTFPLRILLRPSFRVPLTATIPPRPMCGYTLTCYPLDPLPSPPSRVPPFGSSRIFSFTCIAHPLSSLFVLSFVLFSPYLHPLLSPIYFHPLLPLSMLRDPRGRLEVCGRVCVLRFRMPQRREDGDASGTRVRRTVMRGCAVFSFTQGRGIRKFPLDVF
ncbi:hypothetical protein DFH06DRAFT_1248128 [Mycena polygramma]|nr:hypothetical protein DFH06DRAFT_1248128 [Mycena polygramma]